MSLVWLEPSMFITYNSALPSLAESKAILVLSGEHAVVISWAGLSVSLVCPKPSLFMS